MSAPAPDDPARYCLDFEAMASPCRIQIDGWPDAEAKQAAQAAAAEVRRIEAKYSRYRRDSMVSRINQSAGQAEGVPLDAETADLLRFVDSVYQASDGLFDITAGVFRKVWDFHAQVVPDEAAVAHCQALVGWDRVEWSDAALTLPVAGMEIDFGGFGKEYACDRAISVLQSLGVPDACVNLGGDLRVLGRADTLSSPAHAQGWRIGIQHPRQSDAVAAALHLQSGALASSGDYERYFEHAGQRYCHLIDPTTGWPVQTWQSITVLAPACLAAGALATVAMLKQADALAFLAQEGVEFLAIDQHGVHHRDAGVS